MAAKKNTDSKIMDAALALFEENGYDSTTTRAIATRARVNEVTIFRRFGSKERLFHAMLARETCVQAKTLGLRLEPSGDVTDDLAKFGKFISKNMFAKTGILKLVMLEAQRRPELWAQVSHAPLGVIGMLEEYFEKAKRKGLVRDVDQKIAAVAFFSFFFRSLVSQAFLGSDVFIEMDDKAIEGYAEMFAKGLEV
jgi:AcrR family transcriptional regulator